MVRPKQKGFTLVEVVVVMAIIAVLATLVIGAIRIARTSAIETQKRVTLRDVSAALQVFYTKKGRMPLNNSACCASCDEDPSSQARYNASMQELVDAGTLKEIPRRPAGATSSYCYYDYGQGNEMGAIFKTTMESGTSTTGPADSCRPWDPDANWCSKSNNSEWCICNTY